MEGLLLPIVLFGALGVMMYFSVKKQKRAAQQAQQMQDSLRPGTRVMTTSGLHGTVTAMADDTIELEIAPGIRTTWVKAAVREVIVPASGELVTDEALADAFGDPIPPSTDLDGRPNLRKDI